MRITGRCHCGQVSYEAEIDPERVSICHCTDCQSLTGSPFRVTALTGRDQIRQTGAPPKLYEKRGDNGAIRLQYFCPNCGSPLFATGQGAAFETWGIRWGSIDQRAELTPSRQKWTRSAAPWIGEIGDLPGSQGE
jgi:hypothetical protein